MGVPQTCGSYLILIPKDTKEEPPHPPRQFPYQKNLDFVGVVPRVPTPPQGRDPLALQR